MLKKRIPVVAIRGTGHLADILAQMTEGGGKDEIQWKLNGLWPPAVVTDEEVDFLIGSLTLLTISDVSTCPNAVTTGQDRNASEMSRPRRAALIGSISRKHRLDAKSHEVIGCKTYV